MNSIDLSAVVTIRYRNAQGAFTKRSATPAQIRVLIAKGYREIFHVSGPIALFLGAIR